ncbi:MAG TPA: methionyl-tRNA formyltransferase [Actinomycetota bacterium]|jgi:methionyl-tRNA formyltransferase|nr:methionyl-tRNA formyltransferase [Actinomycetota bacterium]
MRAVFFGTPEIALPALYELNASSHALVAVVTAPDRPRGRGMKLRPSPVGEAAEKAGIPVLKPSSLRPAEVQASLAELGAEVFVVVAYGLILPKAVLEIPRYGCLNVHFSLLPLLRGAAPVQWALIEGHEKTGVTIMQMDPGLDTGPILAVREEPIMNEDTAGILGERLALVGAKLLIEVLDALERSEISPQPQDDERATYAAKLSSEDAHIDWSASAERIVNRIRAFNPRPGAWGILNGRRLKVLKAAASEEPSGAAPGVIDTSQPGLLAVNTGSNRVLLTEVQPEGGSHMSAAEFLRGYRPASGDLIT